MLLVMYIQTLEKFEDDRGCLFPFDFSKIPFTPKRFFIVSDVPKGQMRGDHAHHKTEQFLVCLKGSIEVILYAAGSHRTFTLQSMQGVYVPNLVWDSQVFKTGKDVLLVLASTDYDRDDYIESLSLFEELSND